MEKFKRIAERVAGKLRDPARLKFGWKSVDELNEKISGKTLREVSEILGEMAMGFAERQDLNRKLVPLDFGMRGDSGWIDLIWKDAKIYRMRDGTFTVLYTGKESRADILSRYPGPYTKEEPE